MLKVESYRAPIVQLHQSQLGRQTVENLGNHARVYTWNNHGNRSERQGFFTERILQKVTAESMNRLSLRAHATCPDWNYTINPREDRTKERSIEGMPQSDVSNFPFHRIAAHLRL
jgi:hypothetical protein